MPAIDPSLKRQPVSAAEFLAAENWHVECAEPDNECWYYHGPSLDFEDGYGDFVGVSAYVASHEDGLWSGTVMTSGTDYYPYDSYPTKEQAQAAIYETYRDAVALEKAETVAA